MKNIFNLGIQTVIRLKYNHINWLSQCKTEKRNNHCEHEQPMEQTSSLFCMCDSGVAGCQSQHQCHIWWMNSMFEANCKGKWAWQLLIKFCVIHEALNVFKNLKIH